jgi:transglutaminase-like putative cysteine protease
MFERLNHLPRDARDKLFLLLVIGCVIAPQIVNLPVWCSLLALGVLAWRGWLAWTARSLPSRWWVLALLVLTIGATLMTHRTLLGRDAGVTLIVVLLTLKTLELRARRDAFVIFFLSFFTMLTNFFFSQSLLTAAAMLLALLGLLTALVNSHMPVGKPPLRESARTAATMALLGAPIMVVLFMLFPRLAPLWGIPGDAMTGRSGLSASMQVGAIASLALDDSIALRIRFDADPPRQSELYFRGPVLSTLDGREWRALRSGFPRAMQDPVRLRVEGPAVSYQVTLEPNNRPWIFVLDVAETKPAVPGMDLSMSPQLEWVSDKPVTALLRYTAQSFPRFQYGPQRRTIALQDYLDLPNGFNPRTLAWANELRRDPRYGEDPARLVDGALAHLRSGGYSYTLDPGVYGPNTADEFWFDRKEGFCEHIASAFVILMRAMDIPARIVTGYQGGERNGVDGFWVVRQSDAHAWAEVWLAGRGWVRVDPTAAVAPGRVGSLQRLHATSGVFASALGSVSPAVSFNLRSVWEAVNNGWNQWVLNYSQTTQFNLLKNIGFDSPSWEDLSYVLIGLVVFASLCGALWTLWERSRHDPWLRLLERAAKKLQAAGMRIGPDCPPRRMSQLLQQRIGVADPRLPPIRDWLLQMEQLRYAPADTAATIQLMRLRRELPQLPWPA